ncbi:MAG: bifunctional DNA primase/polymerase, partial [Actinobacteria bacterium]|nr:bifunctional DNA primase/polymerase [Actinomycetota bacterium]
MEEEHKITIPEFLKKEEIRLIKLGRWDQFKRERKVDSKVEFEIKIISGKKSKKELDELKDQGWICQAKVPQEAAWQSVNNYKFDDPALLKHIERGYNYGVATGYGGLAIFDDDTADREMTNLFLSNIGETAEVKTGSGSFHEYIKPIGMTKKIIFYNKDGHHKGELQWKTQQCVGPSSIHPTGIPYTVNKDIPILEVPIEKIEEIFKEFIPVKEKVIREHKIIDWNGERVQDIPVTNVVSTVGLHDMGNGNLQGSHPSHGSSTGMNFRMTSNNTWYCYRCLPKDSLILTPQGFKKIQDIKVEEEVNGAKGQNNKVINVMKRKASEKLFTIKSSYFTPLDITEGHEIYIARCSLCNKACEPYEACKPNCPRRKKDGQHNCPGVIEREIKNEQDKKTGQFLPLKVKGEEPKKIWINVEDINPKTDFLVMPKDYDVCINKIENIPLNEEIGELLGWYAAEGHIHKGGNPLRNRTPWVEFTLNQNEIIEANRINELFKKYFHRDSRIYKYPKRGTCVI